MELEQQLQILIDEASQYGVPSLVMRLAVTPVLALFAEQLQHLEYFVVQNLAQDWILTTITNSNQPQQEKQVIYAFATAKDAANFQGSADPNAIAVPLPVTHILFQLFSLKQVDSLIFFDIPGNWQTGKEVNRAYLQTMIKEQLQQLTKIPPNIA
jgi:non-ribosomal peptide synthetase component E (peptide arylation enzyme)